MVKLIIIGGFLGSGKTTMIAELANKFIQEGKKVGVVTNDQGNDLVDTHFLQSRGLSVLEVTGGCFCCNFDEFVNKLKNFSQENNAPDIILAEPVGSCTDLVATIFKPLEAKNILSFSFSPFFVMVDPKRLKRYMMQKKSKKNIQNEINYLFEKQLSEADIIMLNKCDMLEKSEINAMKSFLENNFKSSVILTVSAYNREKLDDIFGYIDLSKPFKDSLDIDYDIYGRAEAGLAWLNIKSILASSKDKMDWNKFLYDILSQLKEKCDINGYEIAHIKAYAVSGADFAKINITSNENEPVISHKMTGSPENVMLVLNARVLAAPEKLNEIIAESQKGLYELYGISESMTTADCFAPSFPNPTHRIK